MNNPQPNSSNNEEIRCCSCSSGLSSWLKGKWGKVKSDVIHIGEETKKVAQDDPRRLNHSIKVGLAITLVSLFYYFDPLYEGFGVNAMWAVLTVVVVFEFSVGATLGKGVNRVMATIIGGMFGVGAHSSFSLAGEDVEPALLGLSVFIIAAVTTFIRFYPKMKARYDYGLVIFILTFSLLSVSGYRDDEVIDMAQRRITTILIGTSTAMFICIVISPVWAGTDLHKLVTSHIDNLADFLLEFETEYFKTTSDVSLKGHDKASLDGFKNVLDSKSNLDTLVNFARWEPRHGRFKYRYPWEQYQKIGDLTRHCACKAQALLGYLNSQIQAPREVKDKLGEPCTKMSTEAGKALKELSQAMTKMTQPSMAKRHVENAKQEAENLNLLLRSSTIWINDNNNANLSLSDVTPVATVAYLLLDVVTCIEDIVEAVQELASLASFKNVNDGNVDANEVSLSLEDERSRFSIKRHSFTNPAIMINERSSPRLPISEVPPSLSMSQQVAE